MKRRTLSREFKTGAVKLVTERGVAVAQACRTHDAARTDVFDYIERFYNPKRRHSKLGYLSPVSSTCAVLP